MTQKILAWALQNKLVVGLGVSVIVAMGSFAGWLHTHDKLVARNAVAEERLADAREANERAEMLDSAYRSYVTETQPKLASLDSMRDRADSLARVAEGQARDASIRAASYGDSLTATLDSAWTLAVKAQAEGTLIAPTPLKSLLSMARHQARQERSAHRSTAQALREQVSALQRAVSVADSTSSVWRRRHLRLERAYEAEQRACQECREALEAASAGDDGWSTPYKIIAGVALIGAGVAMGSGL